MAKMKQLGEIDFSEWNFGFGTLDELIADGIREAVNNTLKDDPPMAAFSFDDGGDDEDDPTTIDIMIPFGADLIFQFSIIDLIDDFIFLHKVDGKIRPVDHPDIDKLVVALRFAADRLEAAKG
jgi:hypothetical protein